MAEKYELAIVKLIGHGYLRLSTNGIPRDLTSALSQCTSENAGLSSSTAVKICDLLIGSVLLVNRFIPPSECIHVLSSHLSSLSGMFLSHSFLLSFSINHINLCACLFIVIHFFPKKDG